MLLDSKGFDLWANDYDVAVDLSDDDGTYPFAGYKAILAQIYAEIMSEAPCKVLDVGVGTGVLTSKLYEAGNQITGVDFSVEMLKISRNKMPDARLIEHDFTVGLPAELAGERFDFIVLTYSIHHLTYDEQINFLLICLDHLAEGGNILIGDVAFETRAMMVECAVASGEDWDDEEFYIIHDELVKNLGARCRVDYQQMTHCSGIVRVSK